MTATPWEVAGYGNGWVVERYVGRSATQWLGGWNAAKRRPNQIFAALADARAARDKANRRKT